MSEIIRVDGYMAFRGRMKITPVADGEDSYERAGDWLYNPETECWYCGAGSYPKSICTVVEVC